MGNLLAAAAARRLVIGPFAASLATFEIPPRLQVRTVFIILAFFAAFYVVAYLAAPALPGGSKSPLGWWEWSDQGLYLQSAQAFSRFDFRGSEHTYPILYSLLAAPFVWLTPTHPFFIVDLACFLVVALTFLTIGSRLVGLLPSAFIFFAVICFPWLLTPLAWVVPWTSTLSAAVTSILILACNSERFAQGYAPGWRYLAFGTLTSLLLLIRPLEFAVGLISFFYIVIRAVAAAKAKKEPPTSRRVVAIAAALVLGACIGPLALVAFNMNVYGSLESPYLIAIRNSGYDLATIPQKFVSLFDDSSSLFLVQRQTLLARFPWVAIAIAMIPSVFVFGPTILRFITILAVAHIALYLPYGDLHPRNLYIYGTIHYFKLWLPYFALIGVAGNLFPSATANVAKSDLCWG